MFFILCDDPTCAMAKSKPLDLSRALVTIGSDNRPRLMQQGQQEFCDEARKEGWLVALNMMLCPGHYQLRQKEEKARTEARDEKRIVVPEFAGARR